MSYSVIRYDNGEVVDTETFQRLSTAVKRYVRMARRHRHDHLRLVVDGNLPGIPAEVIAERFGH